MSFLLKCKHGLLLFINRFLVPLQSFAIDWQEYEQIYRYVLMRQMVHNIHKICVHQQRAIQETKTFLELLEIIEYHALLLSLIALLMFKGIFYNLCYDGFSRIQRME